MLNPDIQRGGSGSARLVKYYLIKVRPLDSLSMRDILSEIQILLIFSLLKNNDDSYIVQCAFLLAVFLIFLLHLIYVILMQHDKLRQGCKNYRMGNTFCNVIITITVKHAVNNLRKNAFNEKLESTNSFLPTKQRKTDIVNKSMSDPRWDGMELI